MKTIDIINFTLEKGMKHYENLQNNAKEFFSDENYEINNDEVKKTASMFMESVLLISYIRLNVFNKMMADEKLTKADNELMDAALPFIASIDILTKEMMPIFNFENPGFEERVTKIAEAMQDNADTMIEELFEVPNEEPQRH